VTERLLGVVLDGAPMGDEEARAFWARFSAYMDEHRGDLAGFAAGEGLASVHPEMHDGRAVLVASRTAPQRAYANAPQRGGASSEVDRLRSGGQSAIHRGGKARPKKRVKSR